ncbi:metallopeptidase [Gammaproteobacteria bacterium]|nr:metallopeptidase [Gammaproteobacteria bacterium]
MLHALWSVLGFLILIIILVGFHEFGHFYAARKLGFKVLKFSIGFGKPLFTRTGKDGCQYILGAIPLGGFVAMLDEREGNVPEDQKHLTFNAQPIWKRFIVVAAGPFANALLAFILLFGLYLYGIPGLSTQIAKPALGTPFAQAQLQKGDKILSVDGRSVTSYQELIVTLIDKLGDGKADLIIQRGTTELQKTLDIGNPLVLAGDTNLEELLGLHPDLPNYIPIIGEIGVDSPAFKAGLKRDDHVMAINHQKVDDFREISTLLQKNGDKTALFSIIRDNQALDLNIDPIKNEKNSWIIGVGLSMKGIDEKAFERAIAEIRITERFSIAGSAQKAFWQTADYGMLVFKMIARMFKGEVKISAMSGPLSIADIAGQALVSSLVSFISLIAIFSINIGAMNLIPIPVLDGGRLVGFVIEGISKAFKIKLSEKLGTLTLQLGAVIMFAFMGMVIFYDLFKYILKIYS